MRSKLARAVAQDVGRTTMDTIQQVVHVRQAFEPLRAEREQVWRQIRAGAFPEALWSAVVGAGAFHAILADHAAEAPGGLSRAVAALREMGEAGFLAYFPALTLVGAYCIDRHGGPTL